MITLHEVSALRGRRQVLRGVNLELMAGEVHALLGENGAGKSTLLQVLTGEMACSAGEVWWEGDALSRLGLVDLARRRAVLPQHATLSFPLSVREVVALGRVPHRARGESSWQADERALVEGLRWTGLTALAERPYDQLSGGERQRVHLARALAQLHPFGEGKWLLLDEPTASQDMARSHEMMGRMRELAACGVGVVMVIHDPDLALRYADKATVLHAGERVSTGVPHESLSPAVLQRAFGVRARLAQVGERERVVFVEEVSVSQEGALEISKSTDDTER